MKKFLVVIFALLFSASAFATTSAITQVAFTTEARTVPPSTLSEVLTIQTQNSGATEEKLTDTADVVFSSSSGTGEFLNSSGNPVTTTMSKNSANKNFYYRDATEGAHTITVTVTERVSGQGWSASQQITVGEGGDGGGGDEQGDGDSGEDPEADKPAKKAPPSSNVFKVDIGAKERTVSVGAPVNFVAKVGGAKDLSGATHGHWSFGDGSSVRGLKAAHAYQFPGMYLVTAEFEQGAETVATRAVVKVLQPEVVVSEVSGPNAPVPYIQVWNKTSQEIALGGWQLQSGGEYFNFPREMVILPGSKLNIPASVSGIASADTRPTSLWYPSGAAASEYVPPRLAAERREVELGIAKAKLADLDAKLKTVKTVKPVVQVAPVAKTAPVESSAVTAVPAESQVAAAVASDAIKIEPPVTNKAPWWRRLFSR